MRFDLVPIIVASSPHAAEQFLKKHDLIFASRPNNRVAQFAAYNQRNLTFAKYGPYWRNMRKGVVRHIKELANFFDEFPERDMLMASMDTSATSINWIFSEIIRHSKVMKNLQKELEQVVGINRMVEESDLEKLEYFQMAIKECFRLHPVGPLLIPHESIEDCTIDGFDIPKGSRLLVNTWEIGRDPEVLSKPEFILERFIGSNIDLLGREFQLLPFVSGRRSCPELQLGLTIVRLC
uniref:Cytochrome P450 n=1 Tax=Solanum lycopersicum TaxID=4081 RepID=A0A3Q7FJX0_SOLLC